MTPILLLVAAQVTVTGTVQYEDRDYTNSGFTGTTTARPIRSADVEILRASDNTVLGNGVTDGTGSFSVGSIASGEVVRARIYARHKGPGMNAVVKNNTTANAIYTALTGTIDTSTTTTFGTVLFTIAGGAAPAFNIFDCATMSFQYQASVDVDLPNPPPLLTLYWESGTSTGTFFSRALDAIFFLGTSSDPDEYDDDIILHEIGHWVAFHFSKDNTLGGAHTIVDQLDPRTSWSEGWAHYWSATVRRFFGYPSPETQVDNFGAGNSVFDIEGPSFPAQTIMATNEVAVAAVLWDITDTANEPFDLLSGNEQAVWQAVNDRIPLRSTITLEDFREGLLLETSAAFMADVTGGEASLRIMNARSIRYYPDSSESNDTPGTAAALALGPTGLQFRTFFGTGDEDWYQITPTPGTLVAETLNLGDGADTNLELYAPDGTTLLASSDDRSATDRSSLIQYAITAGGTYFLRVTNASTVVENGYYDVRAQTVPNVPPVISGVIASATSGPAPLRVMLSGTASDFENEYLEYQWDFEGSGLFEWKSLRGPTVTTTYARPGVYTATLRVVDGAAATATSSVVINVLPSAAPTILFTPSVTSGPAPLAVTFSLSVAGVVPASHSYDFDGDGVADRLSLTGAPATFTYSTPGTVTPAVTVTDSFNRAYKVLGPSITVTGSAPSLSISTSGGNIPFSTALTATYGAAGRLDYDVDEDGFPEFALAPPVPSLTTEIQRAGNFVVHARVTDPSGVAGTAVAPLSATALGTLGWLVSPRGGDLLSGTSVTLTAEAVPNGVSKKLQFQYRQNSPPGSWIDIGGPMVSSGTLFSTAWDVSGLPPVALDLRALVNDTISSGDTANTVLPSAGSPTISESGGTLDASIDPSRAKVLRNGMGVWVLAPAGSPSPLRIQGVGRPAGNGSAVDCTPVGAAFRITAGERSRVRLPFTGDGTLLDLHVFDEASGVWYRLLSRVSHDDGWVEADAIAPGIYALFAAPSPGAEGGSGHGGCGATGFEFVLLGAGWIAWRRR